MGRLAGMEDIENRVFGLIARGEPECFEPLAMETFARQIVDIPAYGRFAAAMSAGRPGSWLEIPAVPQGAYKSGEWLGVFPQREEAGYFETSGTSTGRRGRRPYRSLRLYEAAACGGFRRAFPNVGAGERIAFGFLKESPEETPHSSLSWMFEFWRRAFGAPGSRWLVRGGALDAGALLGMAADGAPLFLAGTAFAFLRWMERAGQPQRLPAGSWIVETGGFKGEAQEISRSGFHQRLADALGVDPARIANEYGMTELFSQAYAKGPDDLHELPPWMRFRIRDPMTGRIAESGQAGLIELVDIANSDVPLALQTEDLGIERGGRLELIGRVSAEPRGCSLGAEAIEVLAP